MKQKLHDKATAVKNHVYDHRARYAALTTLAGCVALQMRTAAARAQWYLDNGLVDEYLLQDDTAPTES
jgi:hypothetical protein